MRYLSPFIIKDLQRKMVFIGGPRQSGKTTIAKELLKQTFSSGRYFNWDDDEDKLLIQKRKWLNEEELLIFDEIHKFPRWKNWVKGIFDKQRELHKILVTGSARLDLYRRGGDSLLGRYHYWRLHPFTLCELPKQMDPQIAFQRLLQIGGFPEPFLAEEVSFHRRWRRERMERVIRDDIRDLEVIKDISALSLLLEMLRSRVGSLIVVSHLAQDLQVAPNTVMRWIELLERMYVVFTVKPYTGKMSRTLSKPFKVYFFDNGDVIEDIGQKFENLVACHLLKRVQFLEDRDGYTYELKFIRDKEKHEVDFLIFRDRTLYALIEAKWNDDKISSSLKYFSQRLQPQKTIQLVGMLTSPYSHEQIDVLDAVQALTRFDYNTSEWPI